MISFEHLASARLLTAQCDDNPEEVELELAVVLSAKQPGIRLEAINEASDPELAKRLVLATLLAALWKGIAVPCDECLARRTDCLTEVKALLLETDSAPEDLAILFAQLQEYLLPMFVTSEETQKVVNVLLPKFTRLIDNATKQTNSGDPKTE